MRFIRGKSEKEEYRNGDKDYRNKMLENYYVNPSKWRKILEREKKEDTYTKKLKIFSISVSLKVNASVGVGENVYIQYCNYNTIKQQMDNIFGSMVLIKIRWDVVQFLETFIMHSNHQVLSHGWASLIAFISLSQQIGWYPNHKFYKNHNFFKKKDSTLFLCHNKLDATPITNS